MAKDRKVIEQSLKDEEFLNGTYNLKSIWLRLDADRQQLIDSCEIYASKTIPSEFVADDTDKYREKQVDFQSFGALIVNNLANKIASSLFPTNMPFFKAEVSEENIQSLLEGAFDSIGDIELALSNAEKAAVKLLYKTLPRAKIVRIMKLLIITGNCLLDMTTEKWKVHTLRNYVIQRDENGELGNLIIRERIKVNMLEGSKQEIALAHKYRLDDTVSIYTGVKFHKGLYTVWQELEDIAYCHKKLGRQSKEDLGFVPLTWTLADGNDYGVGHVEMFYNNIKQLSDKSRLLATLAALNANIKYLVDPAAAIDIDRLVNGQSGEYIMGRPDGVLAIDTGVQNILNDLYAQVEGLKRELSQAFLYNINVVRDAERVTAEEIRLLANEIESGLGGTYSQISDQLQRPIAMKAIKELDLDDLGIEPIVTTGLESLNKRDEASRILEFFNGVQVLGTVPENIMDYINFEQALKSIAANLHLPISIVNNTEQVQQMQQQRAEQEQQMMAQQAGMQAGAQAGATAAVEQQMQ